MRERPSPGTIRTKRGVSRWVAAAGFAATMILTTPAAHAQDGARKILKAMSDYVAARRSSR